MELLKQNSDVGVDNEYIKRALDPGSRGCLTCEFSSPILDPLRFKVVELPVYGLFSWKCGYGWVMCSYPIRPIETTIRLNCCIWKPIQFIS